MSIPYDASELFRFSRRDRLLFEGVSALASVAGVWRYPARREGDLERMGLLDKVYWFHKARHPIEHARRGSGLEVYFASPSPSWELPAGFRPEHELTLSAVGDLFCHPYLGRSTLYSEVADRVFGADVSMANLECLIAPAATKALELTTTKSATLVFDREAWQAVRGPSGYDFVAIANNHALDLGVDGLEASLDILDNEGVAHHGANRSPGDALHATVIERGGFLLGIISWTFGLNANQPPADRPDIINRARLNDGIDGLDLRPIEAQIEDAHQRGCDFVIAQLHWGMEHERYPTPEQVALAHVLAERGVDVIVGHHPHVVQPMEAYRTQRDPDRVVPIFYSLGNLTCAFRAPWLCLGGLGELRLTKGVHPSGELRTYVVKASLSGLRQECDPTARTLRLRFEGPLTPGR